MHLGAWVAIAWVRLIRHLTAFPHDACGMAFCYACLIFNEVKDIHSLRVLGNVLLQQAASSIAISNRLNVILEMKQ